jgi:hypothetical protein
MPSFRIKTHSSYLTGDTLLLHYSAQPVNAALKFEILTAVTMENAFLCDVYAL